MFNIRQIVLIILFFAEEIFKILKATRDSTQLGEVNIENKKRLCYNINIGRRPIGQVV